MVTGRMVRVGDSGDANGHLPIRTREPLLSVWGAFPGRCEPAGGLLAELYYTRVVQVQ